MKTFGNALIVFYCTLLAFSTGHSFAQDKVLAQLQTELVSSWLVTVEGEDRTRTLRISGFVQKSVDVFTIDAEYGWSDEQLSRIWAELSQTDQARKLMLTTQSNSNIVATQMPDGSFAGTFTNKKGRVKAVKIAKLSADDQPATAQGNSGQMKPLASGDVVTIEWLTAEQVGGQSITFRPANPKAYAYRVSVQENGDVRFLRPKEDFVTFARDRFFTYITSNNVLIDEDQRFVRFPKDRELQPGLKWDVPPYKIVMSCRKEIIAKYNAYSEKGHPVTISINGKDVSIETVRINYEADMPYTCAGAYGWRKTSEVLYSPELNEIVSLKNINWNAYCPRLCLDNGSGWSVKAIKTANKKSK